MPTRAATIKFRLTIRHSFVRGERPRNLTIVAGWSAGALSRRAKRDLA